LGDLIETVFTHIHFDSYEAGTPTWTPTMKEEFFNRRSYDLTPYLATFARRVINSQTNSIKFRNDFDATIKDLYRDIYFTTICDHGVLDNQWKAHSLNRNGVVCFSEISNQTIKTNQLYAF